MEEGWSQTEQEGVELFCKYETAVEFWGALAFGVGESVLVCSRGTIAELNTESKEWGFNQTE